MKGENSKADPKARTRAAHDESSSSGYSTRAPYFKDEAVKVQRYQLGLSLQRGALQPRSPNGPAARGLSWAPTAHLGQLCLPQLNTRGWWLVQQTLLSRSSGHSEIKVPGNWASGGSSLTGLQTDAFLLCPAWRRRG